MGFREWMIKEKITIKELTVILKVPRHVIVRIILGTFIPDQKLAEKIYQWSLGKVPIEEFIKNKR